LSFSLKIIVVTKFSERWYKKKKEREIKIFNFNI